MAHQTDQVIRRGSQMRMVRIYFGRDPATRKRKYIGKSIHGVLRDAQTHHNHMLAERNLGRNIPLLPANARPVPRSHWLEICARPRLRSKSLRDYSL
jgi:hypothetical protein